MSISIVIPTYNGERFVEATIVSALNQTRPADEIVISDDNSTDCTLAICEKYKDRLKIFKNPNGPSGFVNGWNNAIAHARCEYISILHQDDLLAPTFLEEMEKAIVRNPDVRHLFAPCCYIDENGEGLSTPDYCDGTVRRYDGTEYSDAYRMVGTPHVHRCPGVITHRSIFDKCKYRAVAGHIADDDFFYRVGQYTDVIGIMKPLASYRIHRYSETGHLDAKNLVKRLLHDYHFQVRVMDNNTCLSRDTKRYFKYWYRKNCIRLFVWGLKDLDVPSMILALRNLMDFTTIVSLLRKARGIAIRTLTSSRPSLPLPNVAFVFAPHPDDEVFGCCGLMQRMLARGKQVELFVMTGGGKSHSTCCDIEEADLIAHRCQLTRKAAAIVGLGEEHVHFLDYPDEGICMGHPETEVLTTMLTEMLATIPNDAGIFIPHQSGEGWSDHAETFRIVANVTQAIQTHKKLNIYEYCVWFWFYNYWKIDWNHAFTLKMTKDEHSTKLHAIDAYMEPKAPCGKPWVGVLPTVFAWANRWKKELYFEWHPKGQTVPSHCHGK
ncbi:MAG: glycosyltransferase [Bacteroidales bacterium]|nr:glycosyltransferase [Bacteroidales bacterium]